MAIGKPTDLEKAEIVLASFRDERECRGCHLFIAKVDAVVWAAERSLCATCWYDLRRLAAEDASEFLTARLAALAGYENEE